MKKIFIVILKIFVITAVVSFFGIWAYTAYFYPGSLSEEYSFVRVDIPKEYPYLENLEKYTYPNGNEETLLAHSTKELNKEALQKMMYDLINADYAYSSPYAWDVFHTKTKNTKEDRNFITIIRKGYVVNSEATSFQPTSPEIVLIFRYEKATKNIYFSIEQ